MLPGVSDGTADWFSNHDVRILLYHGAEARNEQQGNADDGLAAYVSGEDINDKDVVLWYCANLHHHASDRGSDWHGAGPNIAPFGNWS